MNTEGFILKLRGKTAVFIDWANVYGWTRSLKKEVNPRALYKYLKTYKEIKDRRFYYGTDTHPKSKLFLKRITRIGYAVTTKPVKYIFLAVVDGKKIQKRKCDFDMEICIDVHQALEKKFESFIFFTGDGDFEPLYQLLLKKKKQVIVIYTKGHLGREVWSMKHGIFKTEANKFPIF